MNKEKFFISTAIDYVNGDPHIGHALEKIQADVLARYHRSLGEEVLFLSGTDENSLKNVRAAEKAGMETEELVEKNAAEFYELKKAFNLSYDDFIRTTEGRHKKGAEKLWRACRKDIYKKEYQGLYCVGCEEFYQEAELEGGLCPEHKTEPELIGEENYFFRLSKYEAKLKELIGSDRIKIIPETRKKEVLSFIDQGLEDICVSRSRERAHGWGIEVPDDPSQIIWVWFDALSNYITALGYGTDEEKFNSWWEENDNKLHVIGKGILRFHAIYWPALLLSAGLSLPEKIFVHGYITHNGEKMSKSLGNVVDPFEVVEKYGADAVRYFLLREIVSTQDGDFTYERMEERYNAGLAKGIGNLVSRLISVVANNKTGPEIENHDLHSSELYGEITRTWKKYRQSLEEFKFNEALMAVWGLIAFCDQYIEKNRIWEDTGNKHICILCLLYAASEIAVMLSPFLPGTADKILCQLNLSKGEGKCSFEIKKGAPLFPRLD